MNDRQALDTKAPKMSAAAPTEVPILAALLLLHFVTCVPSANLLTCNVRTIK